MEERSDELREFKCSKCFVPSLLAPHVLQLAPSLRFAVFNSRGNRKAHVQFSFMELDANNDLVRHDSATFDFKTDTFTLDEVISCELAA